MMENITHSFIWKIFLLLGVVQLCSLKQNLVLSFQVGQIPNNSNLLQYQHRYATKQHFPNHNPSLQSRHLQKLNLSSSSSGEIGTKKRDSPTDENTFSHKIVQSLDLVPLLESVARHAATKRGRDEILSLAGSTATSKKDASTKSQMVGGRRNLQTYVESSTATFLNEKQSPPPPKRMNIVTIAQSAEDAKMEYELVQQATLSLQQQQQQQQEEKISSTEDPSSISADLKESKLSLPPIYGTASSPFELDEVIYTDDDEWLSDALSGHVSSINLENILQADQIVKKLIELRTWADLPETVTMAPGLAQIGNKIDSDILKNLHQEIADTVQIVRGRSVLDPLGNRSFSFRLNSSKFPQLRLLQKKESDILKDIDIAMQALSQKKSFSSKVSKKSMQRGSDDMSQLDGRFVVPTPRNVASSVGVIRGYSETGDTCYVEPTEVIKKGDALTEIREEIKSLEIQITEHLIRSIVRAAPFIQSGMHALARVDIIFAKAAFGCKMNGVIPMVGNNGVIQVKEFVHPVLADRDVGQKSAVPIDLMISGDTGKKSLIISGPNGGGKTVALKSFGLSAIMCKIGIPIPVARQRQMKGNEEGRVDFFADVLVEVGDGQNMDGGESTLMARLNACSEVIEKIGHAKSDECDTEAKLEASLRQHSLVLLDELGSGTDPTAGAAIARSILEKMLAFATSRVIATTHSPQLKTLSFNDDRFNCASVLLEAENDSQKFRLPTFKLVYGSIGDSYALGAASRCQPPLPDDVILRAGDLLSGGEEGDGNYLRAVSASLEREKEAAEVATRDAEAFRDDSIRCRDAAVSLARAYEQHLSRLERRLSVIFDELQSDESKDAFDIVGESLDQIRLVKKRVKSHEEILSERGLKRVPESYEFTDGENVVIIAEGEWEGETASISLGISAGVNADILQKDEIIVIPSFDWGVAMADDQLHPNESNAMILKRSEIAIWDYLSDSNWDSDVRENLSVRSVPDSRQKLYDVFSSLKTSESKGSHASTKCKSINSSFTSSRQRKAATVASKKNKKKAKRKRNKR